MPQVRKEDDLGIFREPGLPKTGERIWTRELARYLNEQDAAVKKVARRRNGLFFIRLTGMGLRYYWVTPHTAAMIVAEIRATQEEKSKKGDWHKRKERWKRRSAQRTHALCVP